MVEFIRFHFSLKLSTKNRTKHLVKAPYFNIREHYQYIYPDERSSIVLRKDNRTEKGKFGTNTGVHCNGLINNGPQVSNEIKSAEGIQPEFKDILK